VYYVEAIYNPPVTLTKIPVDAVVNIEVQATAAKECVPFVSSMSTFSR
jgi:hypothetical protein